MRIRKRKIPLPLSMLSPVPITSSFFSSDPSPPPWVQLLSDDAAGNDNQEQPAAAPRPIPTESYAVKSASPISSSEKDNISGVAGDHVAAATTRKGSLCSSSSTEHPADHISDPSDIARAMWSSRGKKSSWLSSSSLVTEGGRREDHVVKKPPLNKKRSTGSSSRVMEAGSRCSRVNGRGWRCSQPTLVGYSLCEHHLGKGRIRSISTSTATTTTRQLGYTKKPPPPPPSSSSSDNADRTEQSQMMSTAEEEEDDEDYKRKSKMGSFKARSISSLLDQPDIAVSSVFQLPDHIHNHDFKS
ncbi:hypothetical protein LINGRAHAP2_LOCUS36007 [Linum grandiflorum]